MVNCVNYVNEKMDNAISNREDPDLIAYSEAD